MVWGCMGWNGVGKIHVIDQIMTKDVYKQILEENLLQSKKQLKIPRGFIFQQDNDPKHTANIIKQWFEQKRINVLKWPAQSPDMNPIEHLWAILKRNLRNHQPSNKKELCEIVATEWHKLKPEDTQALIESMPRRISALIQAKGGNTKY